MAFKPVVRTSPPGGVTSHCMTSAGSSTVLPAVGRLSTDDGYWSSSRGVDATRSSSSEESGSLPVSGKQSPAAAVPGPAAAAGTCCEAAAATGTCAADVAEALRGKEAELRRLRETMERNETAIVAVLEERRRGWAAQMTAARHEWALKLRCQQQAAFRAEQSLLLQLLRLQQDNRALRRGDELRASRSRVDELEWALHERSSNDAALTTQLEACDAARRVAAADADQLRVRLAAADAELATARAEARSALERSAAAERRAAAAEDAAGRAAASGDAAEAEVSGARAALDAQRAEFERERERWLDEKRRVIDYQKQLQLNYVQMARKNRVLEADVQQLTAEIESLPTLAHHDQSLC